MITPRKLDERGPLRELRREMNRMREAIIANRIANGVGYRVKRTAVGQVLEIAGTSATEASSDVEIKRFVVQDVRDRYLNCINITEDNQSFYGVATTVLRPLALWPDDSRTAPTGTTQASLDAATGQSRTLDVERDLDGVTKTFQITQVISPPYTFGLPVSNSDTIYAARHKNLVTGVDDDEGNPIRWIDLNIDARRWELELVETLTCVNDELKYILVPRSGVEVEDA